MERGGSTPFNLLPIANTNSSSSAGSVGHGAGTAAQVANWWIRYLTPPEGVVLDPFVGSGTMALEALDLGLRFLACDKDEHMVEIANQRVDMRPPLLRMTTWA